MDILSQVPWGDIGPSGLLALTDPRERDGQAGCRRGTGRSGRRANSRDRPGCPVRGALVTPQLDVADIDGPLPPVPLYPDVPRAVDRMRDVPGDGGVTDLDHP